LGERRGEPATRRAAPTHRPQNLPTPVIPANAGIQRLRETHNEAPTPQPRNPRPPVTPANAGIQRLWETHNEAPTHRPRNPHPHRHPRERGDPATSGSPQRSADRRATKPPPPRHPRAGGDPETSASFYQDYERRNAAAETTRARHGPEDIQNARRYDIAAMRQDMNTARASPTRADRADAHRGASPRPERPAARHK